MDFSLLSPERHMHWYIEKFSKYFVTGGVAALVDAGGFALLIHANHRIVAAGTLSFIAGAMINYCLTSWLVFARGVTARGFAVFLVFAIAGLAVNVGVTVAGVLFFDLPALVAKVTGIGVAFLVNFALNVHIVFGRSDVGLKKISQPTEL
jgi:putative flippase GtrA